jgi:DNA mismatch repair protein MutL
MKTIHQLSANVVSQIAAGEVIERPVYAVKELVENAIDAEADSIRLTIEDSGLKKITVIDNGEGMNEEDLKECFKPHTTSKIAEIDELTHIKTLGFRGEALSSIAAVSHLTINSRIKNNISGISLVIEDSKLQRMSPVGMPIGTSVTVEQLFLSHPVRKKFLHSGRSEFRFILNLVLSYALSYPNIHFSLSHNKKIILDLPKTSEPTIRIEKLLGKDIFESFLPVEFSNSYISISGFLAKPSVTTSSSHKQFLFINNRLVTDKGISQIIKAAYGSLLPKTAYPVCLLHISLPYEIVDINVHPRKEFVRFLDQNLLMETLKKAAAQTLAQYDLTQDISLESFLNDAIGSTQSYAGRLLKEKNLPWKLSSKIDYQNILQIHNLYLFALSTRGFVLVDQHAAHERILFEQLQKEFLQEKKKYALFHFSKPGVFDLSVPERELLLEHLDKFKNIGWDIEHFRNNTFIIRSLPMLFQDRDYVKLLREMLDDFQSDNLMKNIDEISKKMIAYLACRAAVKAGDRLTKKQVKEIVEQLEKTQNNTTCPHGRPTKIVIDLEKINKLFRR